ncbi:AAA family ATPase [Candidatus Parabeggiatoa sp. HSG14]|uniref:AAA family ATPase n=1 Tax=Candidatus Parabeggiatoa sp. HSG14 TaxID=3055593 RepID=UPI0025A7A407|nr:AAA family ATPase [Thiotrichales bacterium HSG14]
MLTLPHYQIGNQIYESVNSLVYRGHRDNQPVILKMLKQDYPTPTELARYQQEYEITHDLDLTGVIKVYGIEKYQNTLVIVLEDFGGESLKQLMANRTLTINEFLPLAISIADILGKIHAANMIHKDINPSNIIVNHDTKLLKIIDFGIASRLPRENPTLKNPEQLEGTLAYLSPEQTGRINRSMDYRTDLYSLGVTFYELLTGQLPFDATDAMELVHCHIAKTPSPVCDVNSDVAPIVSDLIMKLLAKNAEDRYQSAFGVKADLERCLKNLTGLSEDRYQSAFGVKADLEKCQENLTGFENLSGLSFELAQNDFSGKFEIPQKLYGRENEINTLLQAFERISSGKAEMMLVAGYSGVGKTALVHEVHKPMTEKRGYFAAGKFDQFQKNIPYSAITQAFNEFCRYLLMENASILAVWQSKILDAVGNNGQIIIDVIPDLELVIGKQPTVAEVGPTEAQNRFLMFFLNFVKALCDKEHPFILFIDDLQWVDSASLGLLKNIMLDSEVRHLLIIGAYRDNEVDSSHPFIITVDELQKANAIINTIELTNLQQEDINHLLQDSLNCEALLTQPLTDLIYQKTQGNAFFTHQFLHTLYSDALLRFDFEQHLWQWDVEQIAAQNITANVVELMSNKIDKLPEKTSAVLQLAACIGNQFDLPILAIIYEQDQNETLEVLHSAITEGLIQPLDENYKHPDTLEKSQFKFLHDRVQQAAYTLIDDEQKQAVHLQIGSLLLRNTPANVLEEKVFDIVGQINHSIELLNDPAERIKIAQLNLIAGQKAKTATAHGAAVNYLTVGRECLTENSWESEYDLTLALYESAADAAYLIGDFSRQEQLVEIVLNNAKSLSDKLNAYEIRIVSYFAQSQCLEAIKVKLSVLNRLGINFPEDPNSSDVDLALAETQSNLADKSIEDLANLPEMTDPNKLLAIRVLSRGHAPVLFNVPKLAHLMACEQINLSIKYGNTPDSIVGYNMYGIFLCQEVGDIEAGFRFGELSMRMLEQYNVKEFQARVSMYVNFCIRYWKRHLKETLQPLREAYQVALEVGDLEFASYNTVNCSMYSLFSGKELPVLEQEMALTSSVLKQIKQEYPFYVHAIYQQTVLNLMGNDSVDFPPCRLIGDVYNEEIMLPRYQEANDDYSIFCLASNKLFLCYLFQEYQSAFEQATIAEPLLQFTEGAYLMPLFVFHDSLARLAVYPDADPSDKESLLKKVSANQEQMQDWAKHAPMNFQHKYDLVEAEKARVLGQLEAMEWYEKAIKGAADNEYIQEEALAYELAAGFYLARGMDKFSKVYLRDAHYAYQQWGALAKVKDLEAKYPQLLSTQSTKTLDFTITKRATLVDSATRLTTSMMLDLDSVTKAAQTLAGEIVLSKLLKKMMHTLIENAGAERGLLILDKEGQWVIEASGAFDIDIVPVLQSLSIKNRLPSTIINYVVRSHEPVVLANAMQEGIYTEDSYIRQHQLKSILCSPILHQGQLIGLLYLENNLTEGAFTLARLKIVDMLSSQAAISLENALLYRTLEQKVERRTKQLANANQEITLLNERLKEENLRMGAELDVAKQLQQMVLPKESELQQIESLDIAGFMEPADEIGGDYYDVLEHDGHIKIGIGDVTGHGLESGVLMLMVQTAVQSLLIGEISDAQQFLNFLNRIIYKNVKRIETDKNLTLSLLDYQDGQLRITGQHEDVLVVRQGGKIERVDTVDLGFMVGVIPNIAHTLSHLDIQLQPGDGIVLYTDGITEARNPKMKFYGVERLCEVISQNWHLTAKEIQQAIVVDVKKYIGTQKVFDDITLLVLKQQ